MELFNDLPKNKQLTLGLKKELERRVGEDHALFLTEAEISKKYEVSRTTIRQSLEQLVREGYLYRIQGKGTFIAPKKNIVSIILVVDTIGAIKSGCYPQMDFYHGLQQFSKDTMLNIVLLNCKEFEEIQSDLHLIFKGVDKVIFFRTSESYFKSRDQLAKHGYKTLFYGSDSHFVKYKFAPTDAFENESFFIYREAEMINLAVDKIIATGHKRVGIAYSGKTVRYNRFQLIKTEILRRGLEYSDDWTLDFKTDDNAIETRTAVCVALLSKQIDNLPDIIFSTDDWLVPPIYHALAKLGKEVGRDVSIISINNYPFAEILYPALSTIEIPIFTDAQVCARELINNETAQKVYFGRPNFISRASL